jgi:hypothetical protein
LINNRQQSGRRRGRGGQRQNNPGGNNSGGGRGPESGNRIDNRARGNAAQLLEKYKTLARDAQQAGDRVLTEYYLQFADHYFRVLSETRARYEENNPTRARQEFGNEEQGFEGEEGNENQDDDDDFAGSFRQPQRVQQQPQQQAQPQQARDNRGNEDRPRESRPREDRPREDRPRDDRPRDDRPREDRPRSSSYQRDDRTRDTQRDDRPREQPQRETQQQPRDENLRDEQPRENRPRENRVRRDYGDEDRGNRAPSLAPQTDVRPEANSEAVTPAPRAVRRPRAQPVVRNQDNDDGEARLDIGVLPPAFSIPPSIVAEPTPVVAAKTEGEVVVEPRRRGRPRKVPIEAPAES